LNFDLLYFLYKFKLYILSVEHFAIKLSLFSILQLYIATTLSRVGFPLFSNAGVCKESDESGKFFNKYNVAGRVAHNIVVGLFTKFFLK